MTEPYDSTSETKAHIDRVRFYLQQACGNLANRGAIHDASKLEPEEKDAFDRGTPALKGLDYGSPEYKAAFKEYGMEAGVLHHYANNPHHPEFYAIGRSGKVDKPLVTFGVAIGQMSLFDLIEMICDWKAASERHASGNMDKSLAINAERFGIGEQLMGVLHATAVELGFVSAEAQIEYHHHPEISCRMRMDSAALPDRDADLEAAIRALEDELKRATAFLRVRYAEIPDRAYVEGAVSVDWRTP